MHFSPYLLSLSCSKVYIYYSVPKDCITFELPVLGLVIREKSGWSAFSSFNLLTAVQLDLALALSLARFNFYAQTTNNATYFHFCEPAYNDADRASPKE